MENTIPDKEEIKSKVIELLQGKSYKDCETILWAIFEEIKVTAKI